MVKSIWKRYGRCKQFAAEQLVAPEIAPLPDMKAVRIRPFQHAGVDFVGPLYIKNDTGEAVKMYHAVYMSHNPCSSFGTHPWYDSTNLPNQLEKFVST